MRFELRHRILATIEEVERALFDDRYLDYLLKNHGVLLEVQLLEKKDEGDKVRRQVRYRPKPVIKAVGPKPVPPEWFAFVETSTWNKAKKELSFSNVPTTGAIKNLLANTGTLRLRDLGNGTTERVMEGDIKLNLPFLLKPLALIGEKIIQAEGIKIVEAEVPVLSKFIADVLRK